MFQLLFDHQYNGVEKIKVISATFMAACGLQPGRKGSSESSLAYGRLGSGGSGNGANLAALPPGANSRIMARFAAAMIRKLKFMKFDKFEVDKAPDFQLRIGTLKHSRIIEE